MQGKFWKRIYLILWEFDTPSDNIKDNGHGQRQLDTQLEVCGEESLKVVYSTFVLLSFKSKTEKQKEKEKNWVLLISY